MLPQAPSEQAPQRLLQEELLRTGSELLRSGPDLL
jgi:hypothetical protein